MADENDDPPSAAAKMPRVRRRAPTIDLKATELAAEPPPSATAESPNPASEPESAVPPEYSTEPPAYETGETAPQPEPPPQPSENAAQRYLPGRPLLEAGLAGGLVALIVFLVLWLVGLFSGTENLSDRRLARMEAQLREIASPPTPRDLGPRTEELAARLEKLETAAPRTAANGAPVGAAVDGAIKPVQAAVADLARRVADNAAAIREARSQADAAMAAADAARVAAERNNVEALANRVAALERESKTLSDEVAKSRATADDRLLRALVAAQALRTAVERGDSFVAELSATKAAGVDPRALAPLEPFAANGLPSSALLARQLSDLTPEMLKGTAAPTPQVGGFLDRLQANAEKLVRIRPIDETSGDDPAAVISRAQAKAARSDFTGALAELNALPANIRGPAEDWIKKVEARNAAINASRRVVADALAALGKASP